MIDKQRMRFQDAPWFKDLESHYLTIGGAGGIGSWLTLYLSRIGFSNMEVYDFDNIEEHNMGGQWFSKSQITMPKVDAIKEGVQAYSNIDITAINQKITSETAVGDIVFSAFDNMQARKDLFNAWKKQNEGNPDAIFIDGRLSAEYMEIYCIKNTEEDIKFYEDPNILFEDSAVEDTLCSMKQTSHYAAMIGSIMTSFLTNHLTNIAAGEEARIVPRVTKYMGALNMFKSE